NPALEKFVGLVRQMLAHPVRPGDHFLVDMDACGRLARTGPSYVGCSLDPPAHVLVEDDYAVGTERGTHEGFHRGIVDALDLGLVVEILHGSRMLHQLKALAIEREAFGDGA